MRLTLEMIQQAPESINPAKERHLSLRQQKIPAIANLAVTNDAFECIDLSDNDILKIPHMPPLTRLKTLVLCNNRIARISPDAFEACKNIESIVLTNNQISQLVDLKPLATLKNLTRLSLVANPVTKRVHYRNYVVFTMHEENNSLRVLDFQRVTQKEKDSVNKLFGGPDGKEKINKIAPARKIEEEEVQEKEGLTPDQIERIKKAIEDAETIEQVTELEQALKTGQMPASLRLPEKKAVAAAVAASSPKKAGSDGNATPKGGGSRSGSPVKKTSRSASPVKKTADKKDDMEVEA